MRYATPTKYRTHPTKENETALSPLGHLWLFITLVTTWIYKPE